MIPITIVRPIKYNICIKICLRHPCLGGFHSGGISDACCVSTEVPSTMQSYLNLVPSLPYWVTSTHVCEFILNVSLSPFSMIALSAFMVLPSSFTSYFLTIVPWFKVILCSLSSSLTNHCFSGTNYTRISY